jgi:hypothetical protein
MMALAFTQGWSYFPGWSWTLVQNFGVGKRLAAVNVINRADCCSGGYKAAA